MKRNSKIIKDTNEYHKINYNGWIIQRNKIIKKDENIYMKKIKLISPPMRNNTLPYKQKRFKIKLKWIKRFKNIFFSFI